MAQKDPFHPPDDDARALARDLIANTSHAALAVLQNSAPVVTRIALATTPDGAPVTLVSDLSSHTGALRANPICSLLVGEPGEKGDPLTYPRLTLQATAHFVPRESAEHQVLRNHYLRLRPKAKLYIDFADFNLVRFEVETGLLNGGFGRAYKLKASDICSQSVRRITSNIAPHLRRPNP
ncbi:MAG: pyridoxamine 5'-phosphate oxidase family protein [Pseudomonadota bacterium]